MNALELFVADDGPGAKRRLLTTHVAVTGHRRTPIDGRRAMAAAESARARAKTVFRVVVVLQVLCVARATAAVGSLLDEPSCIDDLKLKCANTATTTAQELDILECVQLYEVTIVQSSDRPVCRRRGGRLSSCPFSRSNLYVPTYTITDLMFAMICRYR